MTVIKLLSLCLVLAILLPEIQSIEVVGAHSAAQLWKEKDTKRFWNAITDFLLEHVMNETDFSTEMGDETIVNTLIERVKNGKYEFSRRHRQEVWSVFIIFLYNFDKPAVPENLAKTLKKSGPSALEVNKAFDASINGLSIETKTFIGCLCKFLTKIPKENLDEMTVNGKPFLYDALTTYRRDKAKLSILFASIKNKVKSTSNDTYYAYDYMSRYFDGIVIVQKDDNFVMAKVFYNTNVESCWDQDLLKTFFKQTVTFIKRNCTTKEGLFRKSGKNSILIPIQEKIERGTIDFLHEDNCVTIIGVLFKRFLQSFKESIIPVGIADDMRLRDDVNQLTIQDVLNKLNNLPLPNKVLISEVLEIAKLIYDERNVTKWEDAAALAAMIDPCLTIVEPITVKTTEIKSKNYPMLSFFIRFWGVKIDFQTPNYFQKQRRLK